MRLNRWQRRQSGFTLIELMVAMTIALLLMVSIVGILFQSMGMAESVHGQIVLNQEAREMFRLLNMGGMGDGGGAGDGVAGLRGQTTTDAINSIDRVSGRLELSGTAGNILSQQLFQTNVVCSAAGDPVEECIGTETVSVQGYLANTITLIQSGVTNDRWSVFTLDLVNPIQSSNKMAGADQFRQSYYTIISHSVED